MTCKPWFFGMVLLTAVAGLARAEAPVVSFPPTPEPRSGLDAVVAVEPGNSLSARHAGYWAVVMLAHDSGNAVAAEPADPSQPLLGSPVYPLAAVRLDPLPPRGTVDPVQPYALLSCLISPGQLAPEDEPNDSRSQATPIPLNTGISGRLSGGDEDCFLFAGRAGEKVLVLLDQGPEPPSGQGRGLFQILDPESKILADASDPDPAAGPVARRIHLVRTGHCLIRVFAPAGETSEYRLLVIGESSLQRVSLEPRQK